MKYGRLKFKRIAIDKNFSKMLIFQMIKGMFKLILLILFGFILISPKTRYLVGITLKEISSFILWTVKYEDREKWIIDKPSWLPSQKIKPSY